MTLNLMHSHLSCGGPRGYVCLSEAPQGEQSLKRFHTAVYHLLALYAAYDNLFVI